MHVQSLYIPALEDCGCELVVEATVGTSVIDILDTDTFDNGCAASGNVEAVALELFDIALGGGMVLTVVPVVVSVVSLRASIISERSNLQGNAMYHQKPIGAKRHKGVFNSLYTLLVIFSVTSDSLQVLP